MAATIFFVHGTGVRQTGYDETLAAIKKGLADVGRADLKVRGVNWGVQVGSRVTDAKIDAFLPPAAAGKSAGESDEEIDAEIWRALLADPLFELRLAATRGAKVSIMVGPGEDLPSKAVKIQLRKLDVQAPAGGVVPSALRDAATWLADGDGAGVLAEAANAIGNPDDPDLVRAVARAVVAYALSQTRGELGAGPDALYLSAERDELVQQVAETLSDGGKGIGGWLLGLAKDFAKAKATDWGKQRRDGLMTAASPGIGDIMLYQRRGDEIAALLKREIESIIEDDVYALGHSLGGIFLVDLLSGPNKPGNVKKLITIGSQSPFFYACDALWTLRADTPVSSLFTPWLNIYDRNDFLSFCAQRMFPNTAGVQDVEVRSKVPFPDSHGAYFRLGDTYAKISAFCK